MPSMAMISSPALFSFPTQSIAVPNPNTHLFSASFPNPKRLSLPPLPRRGLSLLPAFAAAETLDSTSTADPQPPVETKRLGVAVKAMEKPRLVLRFIWMEKNIGIALDQAIPGHGTVPLSPYYFWPRKDAWEELKSLLESKPWISQKRMIILLNQATDIINLWQQAGGNL